MGSNNSKPTSKQTANAAKSTKPTDAKMKTAKPLLTKVTAIEANHPPAPPAAVKVPATPTPAKQTTIHEAKEDKVVIKPSTVDPAASDEISLQMSATPKELKRFDVRNAYVLTGCGLPPLNNDAQRLLNSTRRLDHHFGLGILTTPRRQYEIVQVLGRTSYKVLDMKVKKYRFLKLEPKGMPVEGLKLGRDVRLMLNARKLDKRFQQHFLKMTDRGMDDIDNFNYIVTRMGGKNLEDLRSSGPSGQQFSESTALRICLQTLQAIHNVHLCNFVHRNINPKNFIVGLGRHANTIYIMDFELSYQDHPKREERYYYQGRLLKYPWLFTVFQSRNFHAGEKIYREQDLESWIYMCYYFFDTGCIQWKNLTSNNETSERQMYNSKRLFMAGFYDDHLSEIAPKTLNVLRSLLDQESPSGEIDYSTFGHCLLSMEKLFNVDWSAPFQFRTPKEKPVSINPPAICDAQVVPAVNDNKLTNLLESLETKTARIRNKEKAMSQRKQKSQKGNPVTNKQSSIDMDDSDNVESEGSVDDKTQPEEDGFGKGTAFITAKENHRSNKQAK